MSRSELRKDIVSGDWVLIATGRARRPHASSRKYSTQDIFYTRKEGCPFEDFAASGNRKFFLSLDRFGKKVTGARAEQKWFIRVIPNKYPALTPGKPLQRKYGPFDILRGVGYHELVVTRDHGRHWGDYTKFEAAAVFRTYRDRIRLLSARDIVQYVALFHNFGRESGASIYHPHSQILAIPVIPPDVRRSFSGASRYFHEHGRCIHCDLLLWERKERRRVVAENRSFVALCPFASRSAFEVRIFPKRHEPNFGTIGDHEIQDGSDILRSVTRRLREKLGDPPYNFFLHTAPVKDHVYPHYHWHFEIIPKITVWAGFEISTGIDISTVSPERAAALLRRS